MTVNEMHIAVKLLLDKADTLNYPNYEPEEIDFFLNYAQDRFVKHRYDGLASRNRGLEETQKRMDDLRNIVSNAVLTPQVAANTSNYPNGRFVSLPAPSVGPPATTDKYLFSITEQAEIYYPSCDPKKVLVKSGDIQFLDPATNKVQYYIVVSGSVTYAGGTYNASSGPVIFNGQQNSNGTITTFTGTGTVYKATRKRVDVKPIQHDDYNKLIKDPFNRPTYEEGVEMLFRIVGVDGDYEIVFPNNEFFFTSLIMRYLREPVRISLSLPTTDCELAAHTHQEIVDMAVSSMLENIESDRYKSNLNELNKLE